MTLTFYRSVVKDKDTQVKGLQEEVVKLKRDLKNSM